MGIQGLKLDDGMVVMDRNQVREGFVRHWDSVEMPRPTHRPSLDVIFRKSAWKTDPSNWKQIAPIERNDVQKSMALAVKKNKAVGPDDIPACG